MTKKVKIIFTLSLILNLMLLGLIGGKIYKKTSYHRDIEISDSSRDIIRQNIKEAKENVRAQFKQMRAYKDELETIITADQFDINAYNDVIGKMLALKSDISVSRAESMGKTLSELPKEDRLKLSDRFLRSLSSHDPHHAKKSHFRKKHETQKMDAK
jgi:Spy/CpxP family protein refolding chaperone